MKEESQECELCGSMTDIEVHHVRRLADLNKKGKPAKAEWEIIMASRKRKTLVTCRSCHKRIHAGNYDSIAVV